ncbi:MAG: hypothetical protein Q7W51_02870 [Coriobacteriia bacterium]|nr:hypothetical protein [Coriobacteriia bacterium]
MHEELNRAPAKQWKAAVILAAVLVLLVGAAIGIETLMSSGPSGSDAEYVVVVIRDGEVLEQFTMDDIRDFDMATIEVLGKIEEGPTLLAVLEAAGVTDFERVHIGGMGIRDDGSIVLTRAEVTDEVLLDIANRGTVKVVGPDIAWEDRVRDVTEIVVE